MQVPLFLGPSCLCPLFRPLEENLVFKEGAIYIPVFGPYAGEHVVECKESQCRYLGKLLLPLAQHIIVNINCFGDQVSLDQKYMEPNVPVKAFPIRGR